MVLRLYGSTIYAFFFLSQKRLPIQCITCAELKRNLRLAKKHELNRSKRKRR